ncbi:MAG: TRAP transporter small permease subunit [Alphaproteobacteria bacterium]|jgi:TRAP-type mannitol/chloroaromatic compound transport system permease small subunit|nr:TRAP transporter small permease subunit [Alphaproteobacteria bacterium]
MAVPETIACGWPPLDRAARLLDRATSAMNAVGTAWILALMLLINADVVGRGVFGNPINGVPEMVALSILGIVFLQLANTLSVGRLTRSDALLGVLRRRAPRAGDGLDAVFHLAGAALMAAVLWSAWPKFLRSWERQEFVGAVGNFTAPTWPINLIVLVGGAALLLVFVMRALVLAVRAGRGGGGAGETGGAAP